MYYKFFQIRMFFVHLRLMMRSLPIKICAVMLAIWYMMSIIGFGVHTCMGDQRSFVTTFISGMTCEDVHPEHHCHGDGECHDCGHGQRSADLSFDSQPCCSDDFVVLTITGTAPSSENDHGECHCGHCPIVTELLSDGHTSLVRSEINRMMSLPDSGLIVPGDVQSFLGIWRI